MIISDFFCPVYDDAALNRTHHNRKIHPLHTGVTRGLIRGGKGPPLKSTDATQVATSSLKNCTLYRSARKCSFLLRLVAKTLETTYTLSTNKHVNKLVEKEGLGQNLFSMGIPNMVNIVIIKVIKRTGFAHVDHIFTYVTGGNPAAVWEEAKCWPLYFL